MHVTEIIHVIVLLSTNQKPQKHVIQIGPLIELAHVTTGGGVGVQKKLKL